MIRQGSTILMELLTIVVKVHLQHALTAAALNFARLYAWLIGQSRATTRQPAFVRLAKQRV